MIDKFEVGKENARYLKKILFKTHLARTIPNNTDQNSLMWIWRNFRAISSIINALENEENAVTIMGSVEERLSLFNIMDLYNKTKNEELKEVLLVVPGMKDTLTYDEEDKLSMECQFGFLTMPVLHKISDENYSASFQYEENGYIFDFEIISKDAEMKSHKTTHKDLLAESVKFRYLDEEVIIQYQDSRDIIRYIIDNGIIEPVNLNQIKQMVDIINY